MASSLLLPLSFSSWENNLSWEKFVLVRRRHFNVYMKRSSWTMSEHASLGFRHDFKMTLSYPSMTAWQLCSGASLSLWPHQVSPVSRLHTPGCHVVDPLVHWTVEKRLLQPLVGNGEPLPLTVSFGPSADLWHFLQLPSPAPCPLAKAAPPEGWAKAEAWFAVSSGFTYPTLANVYRRFCS